MVIKIGTFNVYAIVKVGTQESDPSPMLSVRMYRTADTNGDDQINFGDINPFVLQLSGGKPVYYATYPDGYYYTGDCNIDYQVNFADINPFVGLLSR